MAVENVKLEIETCTGDSAVGVITLNRPAVHNAVDEAVKLLARDLDPRLDRGLLLDLRG